MDLVVVKFYRYSSSIVTSSDLEVFALWPKLKGYSIQEVFLRALSRPKFVSSVDLSQKLGVL